LPIEDEGIVDDIAIASNDVLLIELPHNGEWVFSCKSKEFDTRSTAGSANDGNEQLSSIEELTRANIKEVLTSKSRCGLVGL